MTGLEVNLERMCIRCMHSVFGSIPARSSIGRERHCCRSTGYSRGIVCVAWEHGANLAGQVHDHQREKQRNDMLDSGRAMLLTRLCLGI